jgi:hypothetical protein
VADDDASIVFVPLVGHEREQWGKGPDPDRRRPLGVALVGSLVAVAVLTTVFMVSDRGDDETSAPTTIPLITAPPTLAWLGTVPPVENAAADTTPPTSAPTSAPARNPTAFRTVAGPRFDRIDQVGNPEFPDVDLFAAIDDLAEDRSRSAVLRALDDDGVETSIETTRDVAAGLDRIDVTKSGPDGVEGESTLLVDRTDDSQYTRSDDSDVWYRADTNARDRDHYDSLMERNLGGLMQSDVVDRAKSLVVASGTSVWMLPSGPAKRFGIYVDWRALQSTITMQFLDPAMGDPDALLPEQVLINVYVDVDNRVVMTTNRLVAGDRAQVLTHTIEQRDAEPFLTLPDPSLIVDDGSPGQRSTRASAVR